MKRHIHNSCYSGITTLQAISEGIAKLTGPKLGQQLLKVFEPIRFVKPPIESMGKLEASRQANRTASPLLNHPLPGRCCRKLWWGEWWIRIQLLQELHSSPSSQERS